MRRKNLVSCFISVVMYFFMGMPNAAVAETAIFKNFTLIDGTGREATRDAAMIVADGRIAWIGPAAQLATPADATVTDLGGAYVIPGLIDIHGHLGNTKGLTENVNFYTRDSVEADLKTYAAYGVTTVQSLGTDQDLIFQIRAEQQRSGRPLMARVRSSGQGIIYDNSSGGIKGLNKPVTNAAEAREQVVDQAAKRADSIKFWLDDDLGRLAKMPPDVSAAIIDEAHQKGLRVVAHVFYLADAERLAAEGVNGFGHSVRDKAVDRSLIDTMKRQGTWMMSATLSRDFSFTYAKPPFLSDPFFTRAVSPSVVNTLSSPEHEKQIMERPHFAEYKLFFENAKRNLKAMADAGVSYGVGTDSGPPGRFVGFFEHVELKQMVAAGLTPLEVLTAATGGNAKFLGANDIGTLEKSKWADFVVLDANPLADIRNTRNIRAVYIAGRPVPTIWSLCADRPPDACETTPASSK